MIHIAEQMPAVIALLKAGINGIDFPDVKPECEDTWSADYAIIQDVIPDLWDTNEQYFDHYAFRRDYEELIRDHFRDDPTVGIEFHTFSDEIEVYRKGAILPE